MNRFEEMISNKDRLCRGIVVFLAFANFFVWLAIFCRPSGIYLEAVFFDVGQGDAAFIELPQGTQILVDGGPDRRILEKLGQAMPFYDREIDWVVLSHPDRDHLNGLLAVLDNYRVRNIIWSGRSKETAECREWLDLAAKEGANIIVGSAGQIIDLGGRPGARLEILAPEVVPFQGNANESSLAVRLVFGQRSLIFTGDADIREELSMVENNSGLTADILKVAHHGSKNSTSDDFLDAVLPAAAVISVGGGNTYGHPASQTLEMLKKYDIKTLRTDLDGDILFRTDGGGIFIKTQK